MFAVGCLALIILPLLGLVAGSFISGTQGAIWGSIGGFIMALSGCAVTIYALVKAGRR